MNISRRLRRIIRRDRWAPSGKKDGVRWRPFEVYFNMARTGNREKNF